MKMIYTAIFLALTFISCDFSTADTYTSENNADHGTASDLPQAYTEFIDSIPDYYQRDMSFGGFEGKGAMYCGPASASNALMWLFQRGHSNLIEPTSDPVKDQHELIKLLGSSKYFRTGPKGTNPAQITSGLKEFFEDRDIGDVEIDYYGWRYVRGEFRTGRTIPELALLKEGLQSHDAVLLNYGWYRYDAKKDEYTRTGGHWVTLTGYGHDGRNEDPSVLIVHDPETRKRVNDYIKTEKIRSGTLKGSLGGLPRKANRFIKFRESSYRVGIIDGAILIKLPAAKAVANR